MMRSTVLLGLALAACSSSHAPPVRFANAPAVPRVNDRIDVPRPPRVHEFLRSLYHFDAYYLRTIRGLALPPPRRAEGVNALDEVPDSTWFTNRIAGRPMTPEEIRRGPARLGSPDEHFPWTIKSSKQGGRPTTIGFLAEDCRGVKFLLKFDRKHVPEVSTGAEAIVSRLLWAFGYNAPEDHVVYFRRGDLRIAPGATFDEAYLDSQLAKVTVGRDGRIRALASIYIDGTSLGGMPRRGVRADDPNDRIPHELRRDQRGQQAVFAWLGHVDVKEDNTLDVWQVDPRDQAVHYVVHYLIDFDGALGAMPAASERRYLGYEYEVDFSESLVSLVSLGLYRPDWEAREDEGIPGIGLYGDEPYDPATWKPTTPGQTPLLHADRFDKFWSSKILIRFTPAQLAAAVESARYSDPRAAKYALEMLIKRQRRTARHWFQAVNPIDEFVVASGRLCFTDLALRHRLETIPTQFTVVATNAASQTIVPDVHGRACVTLALGAQKAGYTILHVTSSRGMPGTQIHLAIDPSTGQPRVIGIHRL